MDGRWCCCPEELRDDGFSSWLLEAGSIKLGCGKEKRKKKELKGDKLMLFGDPSKCLEAPRGSEMQAAWLSQR